MAARARRPADRRTLRRRPRPARHRTHPRTRRHAGQAGQAGQAGPGTGGTAEAAGAREARPTGRRRFLLGGGGAAVLAAGGGGAWWAAARDNGSAQGNGTAGPPRPTHTLALHGDLSGPHKATGRAQERGLRLAVEEFNARRDAPFTVKAEAVDDTGDPALSARVAKRLTDDPSVKGVFGPHPQQNPKKPQGG
ncbi:ABC transporter substrate-binding protein [Streptomyces sp. NPDC058418]|uniref:ABC transporter substrate-binding protein n=1 Tax=Streptomyces sp. NPDC058418 TaxID=3346488 RepID=UPI003653E3F1